MMKVGLNALFHRKFFSKLRSISKTIILNIGSKYIPIKAIFPTSNIFTLEFSTNTGRHNYLSKFRFVSCPILTGDTLTDTSGWK